MNPDEPASGIQGIPPEPTGRNAAELFVYIGNKQEVKLPKTWLLGGYFRTRYGIRYTLVDIQTMEHYVLVPHHHYLWVTWHLLKQVPLASVWRRALRIHRTANMANKRNNMASHGARARKLASKRIASVYEARTGGDAIHKAAGRAANEDAVRRSGLEASEGCRDRAVQERDQRRELAANAALESRDAKINFPEMEASVSLEKELRLAAEAVTMKAEAERLQAELALQAERQRRA